MEKQGRRRFDLDWLRVIAFSLLILSLSEPVFSVRPSSIAIVLDNSASMQALEEGRPRFTLAREKAHALLADFGATAAVDLYVSLPRPQRVHAQSVSPAEAAALLDRLEPLDMGDGALDYNAFLQQLEKERDYDRIYLITDRRAHVEGGKIRVVSVGQPTGNLAITSFQIARSSLVNPRLHATVQVTNFSSKDTRVKVLLKGGDTLLSSRELVVRAGGTSVTNFEGFPHRPYYEAEIDTRDALPLDNRRFAVGPSLQNLRILGVSPRPQALASLRAIKGITLDLVTPAEYQKLDPSVYGLEIFHLSAPAVLPSNSTLLVLPPDDNALVDLQKPVARPVVSRWREPHLLTRYVNFSLFRPSYARPLKPSTAGESIIESPEGPLALSLERRGSRYLVLGFDPFPYLGRDNLPVSVFTLNVLDWFVEALQGKTTSTGEPLLIPGAREAAWLVTPRDEKVSPKPHTNSFAETFYQGMYELYHGGQKQWVPVNFDDVTESDLRQPAAIDIRSETAANGSPSRLFALWPYLLLFSFLLLLVEWFINPWRKVSLGSRSRSN